MVLKMSSKFPLAIEKEITVLEDIVQGQIKIALKTTCSTCPFYTSPENYAEMQEHSYREATC